MLNLFQTFNTLDNVFFHSSEVNIYDYNDNIVNINSNLTILLLYGKCFVKGKIIFKSPLYITSTSRLQSFVVSICNNPIDQILEFRINDNLILKDEVSYTLYNQGQNDPSFPIINKINTSYPDLTYIYIDQMDIDVYGANPKFSFEIITNRFAEDQVASKVSQMSIIPGSGEFVYETDIKNRIIDIEYNQDSTIILNFTKEPINSNAKHDTSDAKISLNQLKKAFPNVKTISLVINWFCDSTDLANISIYPAIEFSNTVYENDTWKVYNFRRTNAREISKDAEGNPNYGGTPSDISVIKYIRFLKDQGYEVILYPMLLVDLSTKPWRGHITGDVGDVNHFFNQYDPFITHCARLARIGRADGMIIGSEFKNITSLHDVNNNFPAIQRLIKLASQVKSLNQNNTNFIVTYAADWSEYNHVNAWRPLDKLWASPYIDVIGIDAYFPLTNKDSVISYEDIYKGWNSGELYDFYFDTNGNEIPLNPAYALKNLEYWWTNEHYNPDGNKTEWIPKSKKIWFTEYGFPSIDKATNQPNVFYDPKSVSGAIPKYSTGLVDNTIQRKAIEATEDFWKDSEFVDKKFLWTWDARPYPEYPLKTNRWSDGDLWQYGHWVNGKIGQFSISDMLEYLFHKHGIDSNISSYSIHDDRIIGWIFSKEINLSKLLLLLSTLYDFSIIVNFDKNTFEYKYQFISNKNRTSDFLLKEEFILDYKISTINDHFGNVKMSFYDILNDYELTNIEYNDRNQYDRVLNISSSIVTSFDHAHDLAFKTLQYMNHINEIAEVIVLRMAYTDLRIGHMVEFRGQNFIIDEIEYKDWYQMVLKMISLHSN